jgi:UDP-N-acetylmuramate dehydrogenase
VGGAVISPMHANYFVNTGGATAADVRALIALTRQTLVQRFGVRLETEVKLVREDGGLEGSLAG